MKSISPPQNTPGTTGSPPTSGLSILWRRERPSGRTGPPENNSKSSNSGLGNALDKLKSVLLLSTSPKVPSSSCLQIKMTDRSKCGSCINGSATNRLPTAGSNVLNCVIMCDFSCCVFQTAYYKIKVQFFLCLLNKQLIYWPVDWLV